MKRRQTYNYASHEDAKTNAWMREQAAKEGKSYAEWCRESGIISDYDEVQIARHETPASWVPRRVDEAEQRLSVESWDDATPGGEPIMSVMVDGAWNKTKRSRRRVGRPRKHFMTTAQIETAQREEAPRRVTRVAPSLAAEKRGTW